MKQLNVIIDDDTQRQLRILSKQHGVTHTAAVRLGVRMFYASMLKREPKIINKVVKNDGDN